MTGIVDTVDVSTEVWGGLVTNLPGSDLPHGASPDCQDCQFQIGSVKTRPGLKASYTLAGGALLNYLKTYENLQEIPRLLSLDSLGNFRRDLNPGGALTTIFNGIIPGAFAKSDSLFAREYIAFSNGTNGLDLPRQYDDTNFDRVSQVGPAHAPAVADESLSFTVAAAGVPGAQMNPVFTIANAGVPGASEAGNIVTIKLASTGIIGPLIGDSVVISGVGVAGYNGTFKILSIVYSDPSNVSFTYYNPTSGLANSGGGSADFQIAVITATVAPGFGTGQLITTAGIGVGGYNVARTAIRYINANGNPNSVAIYLGATGLGNSGGGTIVPVGNISSGNHQVTVIFVTRNGYYTKPAPPNIWTAGGNLRAVLSQIPIGPPNVIARVVSFTALNQASFYHLGPLGTTTFSSNMYIPDNTTTMATFDFTDAALLLGTLDDPLFNQIELPPVAGTIGYSNRLFHWGEQSDIQNFLNLTFDGGFTNLTSATTSNGSGNYPLGWTVDATSGAGGGSANVGGITPIFGDAYTITGDGATAIRGKITQGAVIDYLNNPIIEPNIAYGVQARVRFTGTAPAAGTVHVNLQSTIGGFATGLAVAFGAVTGTFKLFKGTLTAGLAAIPADLQLQVFADGTPTNGSIFVIDNIEIYPLNQQFNNSNVRASFGQLETQGEESYDAETGLIEYNLNDGQSVRSMFKIRKRLYVVKEHSFGVTEDDGVSEPDLWAITDVTKAVGTPSINGVGVGEDWVVIAHRSGLFLYWGGEVLKISEEIQPTWDQINWQYGFTIAVTVDIRKRRIYICAPFGIATTPNKTLVLDYHDVGSDASAIASNPPIHLTYAGTKKAFDRARKWCPWTIAANSVAQIEQLGATEPGQALTYFGSNDGTGDINVLDDSGTVFTDNGNTIPSYYTTAAFAELPTEEAKQLRSHRHLYTYLTMYVQGTGTLGLTLYPDSLLNGIAINSITLSNPAFKDAEIMLNQSTERMFVKVASQGNGQNFDLQRMCVNIKPEPWTIVRGAP